MPEQGVTYTFEDLSGPASTQPITDPNPYNVLINACSDSASSIASRYETHRVTRALQQRTTLLSSAFPGPSIDTTLRRLAFTEEPNYTDSRNCLVLWARPPARIRSLIALCQSRLQALLPHFWIMPSEHLHMTALEFAHSRTSEEIDALVEKLSPLAETATNMLYTQRESKRARLVKPMLTYDAAAVALSFLPAVEEEEAEGAEGSAGNQSLGGMAMDFIKTITGQGSYTDANGDKVSDAEHEKYTAIESRTGEPYYPAEATKASNLAHGNDSKLHTSGTYTYHHVRRDLWDLCSENSTQNTHSKVSHKPGVPIASRYTVPSAHLTIARFVTAIDVTVDGSEEGEINMDKMTKLVEEIEGINRWLESEVWVEVEGEGEGRGEWTIGEEKGLDFRMGSLWYGDGKSVRVGKGF